MPGGAFDPGLVYDSGFEDWISYGCAIGQIQLITTGGFCAGFPTRTRATSTTRPSPSATWPGTRRHPHGHQHHPAGVDLRGDSPGSAGIHRYRVAGHLVVPPGLHGRSSDADPHDGPAWSVELRLADVDRQGQDQARSLGPQPDRGPSSAIRGPPEVTLGGASGSTTITAKVGYTGTLNTTVAGLVGATVDSFNLDTAGPNFNQNAPAAGPQVGLATVVVPAGTSVARFATFDADYPANTDVDLFVYRMTSPTTRVLVASSAGGSAEEVVTLNNPLAATYEVYVDLFAVGSGTTMTVKLNHWLLSPGSAGNLPPRRRARPSLRPRQPTSPWTGVGLPPGCATSARSRTATGVATSDVRSWESTPSLS